jgi:hypothetical protein
MLLAADRALRGGGIRSADNSCYSFQMDAWFNELLRQQALGGFPDFAGSELHASIPISDRLLNAIVARTLPPNGAVRDLLVRSDPGDRISVKITLARPSFLPPIPVTLLIHEQPRLPERPVLILRLTLARALLKLVERALQVVALPPGISLVEDRVLVDIRQLLAVRGLDEPLRYLSDLQVHTQPGAVVVTVRAGVGHTSQASGQPLPL